MCWPARPLPPNRALGVLECPDEELLDLLAAAYRVRRRWFGNACSSTS